MSLMKPGPCHMQVGLTVKFGERIQQSVRGPSPERISRWPHRVTSRRAPVSAFGHLFGIIRSEGGHYWARRLKSMRPGVLVGGRGKMVLRVGIAAVPWDAPR